MGSSTRDDCPRRRDPRPSCDAAGGRDPVPVRRPVPGGRVRGGDEPAPRAVLRHLRRGRAPPGVAPVGDPPGPRGPGRGGVRLRVLPDRERDHVAVRRRVRRPVDDVRDGGVVRGPHPRPVGGDRDGRGRGGGARRHGGRRGVRGPPSPAVSDRQGGRPPDPAHEPGLRLDVRVLRHLEPRGRVGPGADRAGPRTAARRAVPGPGPPRRGGARRSRRGARGAGGGVAPNPPPGGGGGGRGPRRGTCPADPRVLRSAPARARAHHGGDPGPRRGPRGGGVECSGVRGGAAVRDDRRRDAGDGGGARRSRGEAPSVPEDGGRRPARGRRRPRLQQPPHEHPRVHDAAAGATPPRLRGGEARGGRGAGLRARGASCSRSAAASRSARRSSTSRRSCGPRTRCSPGWPGRRSRSR